MKNKLGRPLRRPYIPSSLRIAAIAPSIRCAWDRTLFYVKGGAAITDNSFTAISTLPPRVGIDTASETRWGAAVGVGIEYAFAPNLSLGLEYDHLLMGNHDVNSATGSLIADHIKEDVDLFTARVNYKFGGPVVARYRFDLNLSGKPRHRPRLFALPSSLSLTLPRD